ncbi:MAG: RibD family protein [Spirochaetales bacterium]|nr:RibD family protein [Spirochaetales bacterium]
MLPKIVYHIESSIDGRIDWLKPDDFLYYRIISDRKFDAMISGSTTMLKAEMSPEKDIKKMDDQYLIVVDSNGKIKNWDIIKNQAWWNSTPIVLCSETTPAAYVKLLEKENINFIISGKTKVDLKHALEEIYNKFNINTIRIDSGGILAGVLLRQRLVEELSIVVAPQLTGGESPKTIFTAEDLTSFEDVINLELIKTEMLENNYIWIRYKIKNGKQQ